MEDTDAQCDDRAGNSGSAHILRTDERTGCEPVLGGDMQKGYIGADKALAYLFDNASEVNASQTLTQGTEIARISIDGQELILYAPTPPTAQEINQMIETKLANIGLTITNGCLGIEEGDHERNKRIYADQ